MEFQNLAKAVGSIPHVGQILAVTLTIAVGIYEEIKTLDSKLETQRKLGKDASYMIRDIALYSKNLRTKDHVHLQKLAEEFNQVEKIAKEIRKHIWEVSSARERHIRKYGRLPADVYDALAEAAKVQALKRQLEEARAQLMVEFQWIKMMEGNGEGSEPPPLYSELPEKEQKDGNSDSDAPGPVRWVSWKELNDNPERREMMVPVCQREDTEDGVQWYIARVPHVGGIQPGKFNLEHGAYFGFKNETLSDSNLDFEILIADPGTVRWERICGRYSKKRLHSRPIEGCRENDGTGLVITRALAREHMHIDILGEMYLQPGKASAKLEGAYVTAGKKEVKVKEYEVLVYA